MTTVNRHMNPMQMHQQASLSGLGIGKGISISEVVNVT